MNKVSILGGERTGGGERDREREREREREEEEGGADT